MEVFFEFVVRHWMLVILFVLAFFWLITEEARHHGVGGMRQSPQGITHLINRENAVVIDLRDLSAFKNGHIVGSVQIAFAELNNSLKKIIKYKQRPVVLVCSMGQQSVQAAAKLKQAGFENVYILGGGLAAWKQSEMPLTKN